jgi:tetratricopeptide (TPR) repeat protein
MGTSVCLVLCLTTSNHEFKNLESYKAIVNNVVIYDTGLTAEELTKVRSMFKKAIYVRSQFTDFSAMRNSALSFVPRETDWVIMPDDSWQLSGIGLIELKNLKAYDIIQCLLKVGNVSQKVQRIFKPHLRFTGKVHEYINTKGLKVCELTGTQFEDLSPNEERTKARLKWDIEMLKSETTPRNYYHLGKTYMVLEDYDKAVEHLEMRLQYTENAEEEYLAINLASTLKLKQNKFDEAVNLIKLSALVFPPRAKEAYNNLYNLTRIQAYKEHANELTIGHTQLDIKNINTSINE